MTRTPMVRQLLVDWVPSLVLAVAAGHELLYNASGVEDWVLGQAVVCLLVLRRRAPELVLVAVCAIALAQWLDGQLLVSHLGLLVALHAVASQRPRRHALAAAGLVEACAVLVSFDFAPAGSVNDGVVLLSGLTMSALLLGTTQHAQQQYLTALEGRAEQLERERNHKAVIAAAEERTRIAREIHDIVAHSVSVMIALSEGAAATPDERQSRSSMRQVAVTGREALSELRRVLSVLDDPGHAERNPQPTMQSLAKLTCDVQAAGISVDLRVVGDPAPLREGMQTTIFRIVQEALTNTLKHAANATRSTVLIDVRRERVLLSVRDDGGPVAAPVDVDVDVASGNGINGMCERARLFDGAVVAGPTGDGWAVTCTLQRVEEPA